MWPSRTSLMFVVLTMRKEIAHEGRLCRPDDFNAESTAPGGSREGGLPPSR
jgi:hypothetical protein